MKFAVSWKESVPSAIRRWRMTDWLDGDIVQWVNTTLEQAPRPWILDLCCGAGGASVGYASLGWTVVGVDINPQPAYPFHFIRGDALETCGQIGHIFDYIHASPPCQCFSKSQTIQAQGYMYPDLVTPLRPILNATRRPWVIENVTQAPMRADAYLCGTAFGEFRLRRHRIFEFYREAPVPFVAGCRHRSDQGTVTVFGHGGHIYHGMDTWRKVMAMPWGKRQRDIAEAIPPYYSAEVGRILAWLAS